MGMRCDDMNRRIKERRVYDNGELEHVAVAPPREFDAQARNHAGAVIGEAMTACIRILLSHQRRM